MVSLRQETSQALLAAHPSLVLWYGQSICLQVLTQTLSKLFWLAGGLRDPPFRDLWTERQVSFPTANHVFGLPRWLSGRVCLPVQEMQETPVWSLGGEEPPGVGSGKPLTTLAWRIPQTKEPGGLQSIASQKRWIWLEHTCKSCMYLPALIVN